jgi:hypothetical protein
MASREGRKRGLNIAAEVYFYEGHFTTQQPHHWEDQVIKLKKRLAQVSFRLLFDLFSLSGYVQLPQD